MGLRHAWLHSMKGSVLALLLPAAAAAQPPADLDTIDHRVTSGQQVIVTVDDGNRVKGRVTSIERSGLTLLVQDENGKHAVTLPASGITTIRKNDSLLNGFLIGLGAGLVGAEAWIYSMCGPPGYDVECRAIATPVGWAAIGGGGVAIGTLIDKFSTKLLYRASSHAGAQRATAFGARALIVQPLIGREAPGLKVSVTF